MHVLNLFHYFAGEPRSCSGILLQDGEPLTRKDIRPGAEGLGSLGANEIHARWHMQSGLIAHYTTLPRQKGATPPILLAPKIPSASKSTGIQWPG